MSRSKDGGSSARRSDGSAGPSSQRLGPPTNASRPSSSRSATLPFQSVWNNVGPSDFAPAESLPPRAASLRGRERAPNPAVSRSAQTVGVSSSKGKGKGRDGIGIHQHTPSTISSASSSSPVEIPYHPYRKSSNVVIPADDSRVKEALSTARHKVETKDAETMRRVRSTLFENKSERGDSDSSAAQQGGRSRQFSGGSVVEMSRGSTGRSELESVTQEETLEDQTEHLRSAVSELKQTIKGEAEQEDNAVAGPSRLSTETSNNGHPPTSNAGYRIAVIGHSGVGKSTIIKRSARAWGVSPPVEILTAAGYSITSSISQIQLGDGSKEAPLTKIEFLEMDMAMLHAVAGSNPGTDGEAATSTKDYAVWRSCTEKLSGAIICYDATRSDTLEDMTVVLDELSQKYTPMIIFACKSDPDVTLQVDAHYANALAEPYNVGLIEVTTESIDGRSKMRNGLRWLLYKVQRQRKQQRKAMAVLAGEGRRSSDTRTMSREDTQQGSDESSSVERGLRTQGLDVGSTAQTSLDTPTYEKSKEDAIASGSGTYDARSTKNSIRTEGPSIDMLYHSPERPSTARTGSTDERPESPTPTDPAPYVPLEELLIRFFTKIVSADDHSYVHAFLLTFRRFCYPTDLMREFLDRIKEVELYADRSDIKIWALMKLTDTLIDWTTTYPGDIVEEATYNHFLEIISILLHYPSMVHQVQELSDIEARTYSARDVDRSWALPPLDEEESEKASIKPQESSDQSQRTLPQITEPDVEVLSPVDQPDKPPLPNVRPRSSQSVHTMSSAGSNEASAVIRVQSGMGTTPSDIWSGNGRFSGSEPRLTTAASISGYSQSENGDLGLKVWTGALSMVMTETEPMQLAVELSKIQWSYFEEIRPRDVLRHDLGKERDDPVGKAITFFNHISRWVSTLILANPKPKHRARVYERFVAIAVHLLTLRNYDTLYAFLSGMQETSIVRMTQTMNQLVLSPSLIQSWDKIRALMDAKGGYAKYRSAIKADLANDKPVIPLLTSSLALVNRLQAVRGEDIRPEDGAIQWDKFCKFAEYLLDIEECQLRGSPVSGRRVDSKVLKIVEDESIVLNEDGLYERSRALEPGGGAPPNKGIFKRFGKLSAS